MLEISRPMRKGSLRVSVKLGFHPISLAWFSWDVLRSLSV